jgi:hypothetical protein
VKSSAICDILSEIDWNLKLLNFVQNSIFNICMQECYIISIVTYDCQSAILLALRDESSGNCDDGVTRSRNLELFHFIPTCWTVGGNVQLQDWKYTVNSEATVGMFDLKLFDNSNRTKVVRRPKMLGCSTRI